MKGDQTPKPQRCQSGVLHQQTAARSDFVRRSENAPDRNDRFALFELE